MLAANIVTMVVSQVTQRAALHVAALIHTVQVLIIVKPVMNIAENSVQIYKKAIILMLVIIRKYLIVAETYFGVTILNHTVS